MYLIKAQDTCAISSDTEELQGTICRSQIAHTIYNLDSSPHKTECDPKWFANCCLLIPTEFIIWVGISKGGHRHPCAHMHTF